MDNTWAVIARLAKGEYPSFCKVEKLTGHAVLFSPYLKQLVEAAQRKFQKARRNRIERTIGKIGRIMMSPRKAGDPHIAILPNEWTRTTTSTVLSLSICA
jgi:hypothetical protein